MNNIFTILKSITIYDSTITKLNETENDFINYINKLETLPEHIKEAFTTTIGQMSPISNQQIENIDQFDAIISSILLSHNSTEIINSNLRKNNGKINEEIIKNAHKYVIHNLNKTPGKYRKETDDIWFGIPGEFKFIPPNARLVPILINELINFFNEDYYKREKNHEWVQELSFYHDHPFIKSSILSHFFVYIHPFKDGNGRMARILQHCFLLKDCNCRYNLNFRTFPLNLNESILQSKPYYIKLLNTIHANPGDNDAWNNWFVYNLNLINEQIYYLNTKLDRYQKFETNNKSK